MGSLLMSTRNTRALPLGGMRYIRSDVPAALTEGEIQWLLENNITAITDLRSEEEVRERPCCLAGVVGFDYLNLPVTGGGGTPKSQEQLHKVYRNMLDSQMERIVSRIMNARTNSLYFCTAGKDRTGVVSAVILKRLGAGDDVIIEDYMKSGENLKSMLTEYAAGHPEADINIITPKRENMERLLAAYERWTAG